MSAACPFCSHEECSHMGYFYGDPRDGTEEFLPGGCVEWAGVGALFCGCTAGAAVGR